MDGAACAEEGDVGIAQCIWELFVRVWVEQSVAVAWDTAVVDAPAGWGGGAAVAVVCEGCIWFCL